MLIGLNALKNAARDKSAVLDAWFSPEQETQAPVKSQAGGAKSAFSNVLIANSIKSLSRAQSEVPALPRHAQAVPGSAAVTSSTPYQILSNILEPTSPSSRWLSQHGLLQQFYSKDCFVDLSTTSDGGMSAVLRSPEGYRRTVVCRVDGTSAQRITGPRGEEIVRFNNSGEPVNPANKADNALAIA